MGFPVSRILAQSSRQTSSSLPCRRIRPPGRARAHYPRTQTDTHIHLSTPINRAPSNPNVRSSLSRTPQPTARRGASIRLGRVSKSRIPSSSAAHPSHPSLAQDRARMLLPGSYSQKSQSPKVMSKDRRRDAPLATLTPTSPIPPPPTPSVPPPLFLGADWLLDRRDPRRARAGRACRNGEADACALAFSGAGATIPIRAHWF